MRKPAGWSRRCLWPRPICGMKHTNRCVQTTSICAIRAILYALQKKCSLNWRGRKNRCCSRQAWQRLPPSSVPSQMAGACWCKARFTGAPPSGFGISAPGETLNCERSKPLTWRRLPPPARALDQPWRSSKRHQTRGFAWSISRLRLMRCIARVGCLWWIARPRRRFCNSRLNTVPTL